MTKKISQRDAKSFIDSIGSANAGGVDELRAARGAIAGPTMIDVCMRDSDKVHVIIYVQPGVDPEKVRSVLKIVCPRIFGVKSTDEIQTYSKLVSDEVKRYGQAIPVWTGDGYNHIDTFEIHLSPSASRPYINKLEALLDAFVRLITKNLHV